MLTQWYQRGTQVLQMGSNIAFKWFWNARQFRECLFSKEKNKRIFSSSWKNKF